MFPTLMAPAVSEGLKPVHTGGWPISNADFLIFNAQKGGERGRASGPVSQTDPKQLMIMRRERATGV